ncbi:MAG: hypothetical protein WAX69_18490 [Victivallales bacterium]
MGNYVPRYKNARWHIIYGSYEGIEKFAVDELQKMVQDFFPYVVGVHPADAYEWSSQSHHFLLGTAANNPRIRELADKGLVNLPYHHQGYSLTALDSPDEDGMRIMAISGFDQEGVLYGVEDFHTRILGTLNVDEPAGMGKLSDAMPGIANFSIQEHPLIENRGIWTWGYVIYDYRRLIDNMARMKMNMLTIWNDCPPLNCREVVDYAHSRGVKVILGFHWGWGIEGLDPTDIRNREKIKAEVVKKYRDEYTPLGMDGIYFQSFTERKDTRIGDKSIARLVCGWVNEIAADVFKENPDLHLQFGLHATSIAENYADLKDLDPRIVIVWEDAGVIPFFYDPVPKYNYEMSHAQLQDLNSLEATIKYSRKLAEFRGKTEFGMVPKGWICLRWGDEFEHHGPFVLGCRSPEFIHKRLLERRARWNKVNKLWLENYPLAMEYYRQILDCNPLKMTVTGLIEDGLFEEEIPVSAAIFAETLWNPKRDEREILSLALGAIQRNPG